MYIVQRLIQAFVSNYQNFKEIDILNLMTKCGTKHDEKERNFQGDNSINEVYWFKSTCQVWNEFR